jgi:dimethylargininase
MVAVMVAITRAVSPLLAQCELTHLARQPIDLARAIRQHAAYEDKLRSLGATIRRAPAAPELADSVFVEDAAIALDEVAIITRPGAPSRRPETAGVADVLAEFRPLIRLQPPATLDGGDVLRVGPTLYIGQSSRTNAAAVEALQRVLKPFDYQVIAVEVTGCLHLKSAATLIGDGLLLVNPAWFPATELADMQRVEVDPMEPYAANALRVGETLIFPTHFPRTLERLLARGLAVETVQCDELAKAEGAVTCCCVLVEK